MAFIFRSPYFSVANNIHFFLAILASEFNLMVYFKFLNGSYIYSVTPRDVWNFLICTPHQILWRGADKSLARPTSRCILFDGENISFNVSLVIYINRSNILPIMIINRIYEY